MGLLLIILGLVVALLLNYLIGIVMIIIGLILMFIPSSPYGSNWYRGRRR